MYTALVLAGMIMSTLAMFDEFFDNNCTRNQFACRNSHCIPKDKRCDGHRDCHDGSDEFDCEMYLCKSPMFFRCHNRRCISGSLVCNGDNDCEDFSDERNCKNSMIIEQITCLEDHWQCTDKMCIPRDWVCNGEVDCMDGSDESLGCSGHIDCDGFKCANGHCIPTEWRCDGSDDCNDNSDEKNCETYLKPEDCTLEKERFLCSDNKTCIVFDSVCNGKSDCPDKSDEGPACSKTCDECEHKCIQLPTGPKCICPPGYKTVDNRLCQDINECEIFGICDQKCKNKPGSYQCYCDRKYILQSDNHTCKAIGEASLVFSSKTEVRQLLLLSDMYIPVARQLKQVVGVAFDGQYVYWTDIFTENESIVRSTPDGTHREVLISSGLGAPEDLAIDYLTGNIYFTDAERRHIGVCTHDGIHCVVIVNKDIQKPRGIVLNVAEGEMYWTDWGKTPEIARSKMDGTEDITFVANDIKWPNGLAIDYPNGRLYWTDAKLMTLESIKLDGTDRRMVLDGIVKHPYSVAVFENRLFWSDWATHSIQSCDKFTGKNHQTLIKENSQYIYGISIYHSTMKTRIDNPCAMAFCSDICLLSGPGQNYTCGCPQNKEMSSDGHKCKEKERRQTLVLGVDNMLVYVEHQLLGKHDITALPILMKDISALAYDGIGNTLYVADKGFRDITAVSMHTLVHRPLHLQDIGKIISMDFDYLGNNLYWCDAQKSTIEVLNMHTSARRTVLYDMAGEIPESIVLVPEESIMFVSFKKKAETARHVDKLSMDGSERIHVVDHGLIGPVTLYYDQDVKLIFIADSATGNIETIATDGNNRHGFRSLSSSPIGMTSLNQDLFWVNQNSKRLCWADKRNSSNIYNRRITLDLPVDTPKLEMHIVSVTPRVVPLSPCNINNANCSHICMMLHKTPVCSCPIGMNLASDNQTCTKPTHCDLTTQFHCTLSNICVPKSKRCNSITDCPAGEDEEHCQINNKCPPNFFRCLDGECIDQNLVCNYRTDCLDKSDEYNCSHSDNRHDCPPLHFRCADGKCISETGVCDGALDCDGGEDESNCLATVCKDNEFKCQTGTCIPKLWECDHAYDCPDWSDEHIGCFSVNCSAANFRCVNNKCIESVFVCDGHNDCGDNSDESHCHKNQNLCGPDEFACKSNTSICLHHSARCNGSSECPHHEDEADCSSCNVDEFTCSNMKCIPLRWLCDHSNDCGDGSDEQADMCFHNLDIFPHTNFEMNCIDGFRCKTGHCIDFPQVCDGFPNCYDGSDENGSCNTSCGQFTNPCAHVCLKTPSGPRCMCKPGYKLLGDSQNCEDVDECKADPPVCSQLCVNFDGGYTCDCFDGFMLRTDKTSCKSKGAALSLIYVFDNQIRQLSQKENSLRMLYAEDTPKITGLDVSINTGYIYFSIESSETVHRINIHTHQREYFRNMGQPQKIALDWATENLYFIDGESGSKSIRVCNFKEQKHATLIKTDVHNQISALTIDSFNKFMFYSSTNWFIFNSPTFTIYRADLDGRNVLELVKSNKGYVTSLTYDMNKRKLYYVDQHTREISRINYDGSMKNTLIKNLTRPTEIEFYEDHIYYLETSGYMGKCRLYGNLVCDHFKLDDHSSDLFAVMQESRQPMLNNSCLNHNCSFLCISGRVSHKCLCADGTIVSPKGVCGKEGNSEDGSFVIQTTETPLIAKSTSSTTAAIVIPLCILVLGIIAYIYVKKRNNSNMSISSIRFHNPGYGMRSDESEKAILQPGQHEYANPIDSSEPSGPQNKEQSTALDI